MMTTNIRLIHSNIISEPVPPRTITFLSVPLSTIQHSQTSRAISHHPTLPAPILPATAPTHHSEPPPLLLLYNNAPTRTTKKTLNLTAATRFRTILHHKNTTAHLPTPPPSHPSPPSAVTLKIHSPRITPQLPRNDYHLSPHHHHQHQNHPTPPGSTPHPTILYFIQTTQHRTAKPPNKTESSHSTSQRRAEPRSNSHH